jgi:YYY domain-containing protein
MVLWGLGIPLGITAWLSFLAMGWRILKGEWKRLLVLWGWTGAYFLWQSLQNNPTMRYQLPIYPALALIAAWGLVALWQKGHELYDKGLQRGRGLKIGAGLITALVVLTTFAWAFAFTQIYTRPVTRVAASDWIYANVPGPINLELDTATGSIQQPLGYRSGINVLSDTPISLTFTAEHSGLLSEITLERVSSAIYTAENSDQKTMMVTLRRADDLSEQPASAYFASDFSNEAAYTAPFDQGIQIIAGETYTLTFSVLGTEQAIHLNGQIGLHLLDSEGNTIVSPLVDPVYLIDYDNPYSNLFTARSDGLLTQVTLPHVLDWSGSAEVKTLRLEISAPGNEAYPLASVDVQGVFSASDDRRGDAVTFQLAEPVQVTSGETYSIRLSIPAGSGKIAVYGSKHALESTWDDALPLVMNGYDPFGLETGIYRSDLNFEMYYDDNQDKLERFESNLDQADYIYITSNRQWGTTTRVPERYPLTTQYYRSLLGCPEDQDLLYCYRVAEPGMYNGELGFELVEVFQSNPNIGSFEINTQFAEEAFTVYDHPKVLIFRKTAEYESDTVREILGSVDLSKVIHLTPQEASKFPGTLELPADRLEEQQSGGTWVDLFNPDALVNSSPFVSVLVWYLAVTLLGWMVYPTVRLALGGLPDRGYPVSKLTGLLLLALLSWLAGSAGIAVTRLLLVGVVLLLLIINAILAYWQRDSLRQELHQRRKYFLAVEIVALTFFAFFLLIRLGNSDLWHPSKGGEKPMDFSYFNAVLKSSTFPPYDPWYAGGYINYYYYGFVVVGMLVKLLGITPSVAYNLVLPSLFSFVTLGAFSLGWNLLTWRRGGEESEPDGHEAVHNRTPYLAGISAALGMAVLGNLGTVRMIWQGLQKLAHPDALTEAANLFVRIAWAFKGLGMMLSGASLSYYPGDWYWIPSRVYSGWEITEFPFFTFLYADLHAHLIALPITLLVLLWSLSVVMGRWQWQRDEGTPGWLNFGLSFLLGSVVIGALRPTNMWDLPAYLGLALLAVVYTALRYGDVPQRLLPGLSYWLRRGLLALGAAGLLTGLVFVLYQPFTEWYAQGYNAIALWEGNRSAFWSYLTHWGLFLFVIVGWLVWETHEWLASTPLSSLNKLRPYRNWIYAGLGLVGAVIVYLLLDGVQIAWLTLPLAIWAGVLVFRPKQPDVKRFVLVLVCAALMLTLAVEVIVLVGDIDRMNTVFKFYLQAWTMLSISAAAALFWLLPGMTRWSQGRRNAWQTVFLVLVLGAALYPLLAGLDKVTDRMSSSAPRSLDGMAYMETATYSESGVDMDLSEDYRAIQWMQRNVEGSPVIVEANSFDLYRWFNRFTVYTGLPGVVGWDWHQRQQRTLLPGEWVSNRVNEIQLFYTMDDYAQSKEFLEKYDVKYIIVGQLERAKYGEDGLVRFEEWNGDLWQEVYRDGQTAIYEVLP